jgi:hypothetical protein
MPQTPLVIANQVFLNGSLQGVYLMNQGLPDVGARYSLFAAGRLTPIGPVAFVGNFTTLGFIAQGQVHGTVTLYAQGGTLTLSLLGPTQKGFSPPPSQFQFQITHGTGAYANDTGAGMLSMMLHPVPGGRVGTLTLDFVSVPPMA